MSYLYFIAPPEKSYVKIGISDDVDRRLKQFQTAHWETLKVIRKIKCKDRKEAQFLETELHRKFSRKRVKGEWFKSDGQLDYFIKNFDPTTNNKERLNKTLKQVSFWMAVFFIVSFVLILIFNLKG